MNPLAKEQFAQDFLLVAMNDEATYKEIMKITNTHIENDNYSELAENLEIWWSWKVEAMTNATAASGKPILGLFISQFLNNWGVDTWQQIADYLWDTAEEITAHNETMKG